MRNGLLWMVLGLAAGLVRAEEPPPPPPTGTCPIIRETLNQAKACAPDQEAAAAVMKGYSARLKNSKNPKVELLRLYTLADVVVRSLLSEELDLVGLPKEAAQMRALAPILNSNATQAAQKAVEAVATTVDCSAENAEVDANEADAAWKAARVKASAKNDYQAMEAATAKEKAAAEKAAETARTLRMLTDAARLLVRALEAAPNIDIKDRESADVIVGWLVLNMRIHVVLKEGRQKAPKLKRGTWQADTELVLDALLNAQAPDADPVKP